MDLRDQLAASLEAQPAVRFALLFGSRVSGSPRPDSDWDVAVFLDEALDARERFALRCRLVSELEALVQTAEPSDERRVDLVVLNDATSLLGLRALRGEWLVRRDELARVRYTVKTLSGLDDERHGLAMHWRGLRQRMEARVFGRP